MCAVHPLGAQSKTPVRPILVELFTSEGCSDCPPADALLARLDHEQFAPGVHAIVLSEHVTYWNHLGWRDPFSMPEMDERQRDYQVHFNLESVYTPQMVVEGAEQFVGSDANALNHALTHTASEPAKPLAIEAATWNNNAVQFTVNAAGSDSYLHAALAEDATRSEVGDGENAGRTLHHVAVVRAWKEFKSDYAANRPLSLPFHSTGGPASSIRLVVFLSDPRTGHVLAVAAKTLQRQ